MNILRFTLLVFLGGFISSCDNDLDLTSAWQDIPVVYGLLSVQDTAHYIRVEKAFLDPTTSALTLAQRPDSLYYDDAEVSLSHVSSGTSFTLQRVDGNLEGYPRTSGVFAEVPNILYKITNADLQMVPGDEYQLSVNRNDNTTPVTSTIPVLGEMAISQPMLNASILWQPVSNTTIIWDAAENARYYELRAIIHIDQETGIGSGEFESYDIDWLIESGIDGTTGSSRVTVRQDGIEFFQIIAAEVTGQDNLRRVYRGLDFVIDAGGEDLWNYIQVGNANTGITSAQEIPRYTNISEGLGLFSSRSSLVAEGYGIHQRTRDSLIDGSITAHLNFE